MKDANRVRRGPLAAFLVALLVLTVGAHLALAGTPGDFTQPVTSPEAVGGGPRSVAAGDFDGDGIKDLAVANYNDGTVTILLGDGTGDFTPAATSPEAVGTNPVSLVAADFNSDGKPDLAVVNFGTGNVTILLGDGTGNFTAAATSPEAAGSGPVLAAAADFNGDGKADLAIANNGSNDVTILLGDGTGNFTAAATSPEAAGAFPQSVAAADLTGDGKTDLAIANNGSSNVSILVGDGNGDFTPAPTSPETTGGGPHSVAAADLNGDGNKDLAVADQISNDVTILLGDGAGDFTPAGTSPEAAGSVPLSVAATDLNGDGNKDLAVANFTSNNITILLGDGTGNFTAPGTSPEPVGFHPFSVAAADLNGDGKPDLATANSGSTNVTILLNQTSNADLALSLADSPDPVAAGATLTYTLTATNRGPDDATGATIADTLPAGVTFLSASAGCTKTGATVTCALGALPDGATKQRQILVRPTTAGTLTDSADLSAAEQDLRSANNDATEQTTVNASQISCQGHPATIVGSASADTLTGTTGVDAIAALGGDDTVKALGGDDFLCGGAGDDSLNTGSGHNAANGGSGDDTLTGNTGIDTLRGGSGADTILASSGNDSLFGNDGDDSLNGGLGTDACNGGSDTDTATACESVTGVP